MSTESSTSSTKQKTLLYSQDKFIFNKEHFICIKGTWGCGKSLAGLYSAYRECKDNPNNLYLIMRKEWVDLRDSTIQDWNKELGMSLDGDKNVTFDNGSVLMFRHGDDLNALKNINLGGCLMVQAEEMSEDDFWFLNGRLRRQEGTRQLRLECNYDGHNWIYELFNKQKVGTLIITNTFDNECNLPPDYIPNLKKLPKRLQERYLYGSDADMEGAVWDEFNSFRNTRMPFYIPYGWQKIVILDHGFTNPTAILWAAVDWDGKVFIYDEHYEAGKTVSYHSEQIKLRDNSGVRRWLIDPSCSARTQQQKTASGVIELHSIIDEYADYGIRFEPADNNLLGGINRVNEAFKSGKLIIFKNCENTIREVENWKWRKLRPGIDRNAPEEPVDKNEHTCDCLRYLMSSRLHESEFKDDTILPLDSPLYKLRQAQKERLERVQEYDISYKH